MAFTPPRSLGKGRVLGARPQPPQPSPLAQSQTPRSIASSPSQDTLRAPTQPGFLSPSESSLSLNSQQSTSKSSNDEQEISAALAHQAKKQNHASGDVGVVAQTKLFCPICNEEMVTLLQLNRHLDDTHKEIQEEEQDEIENWFKSQVIKAKKFQPLAVLNQKFKGLDVFDLNEEKRAPSTPPASHLRRDVASGRPSPTPGPAQTRVADADEIVTRQHWQRYTQDGTCSDPMCSRRLGGVDGRINCRSCGRLFCEEHTMYQMKLSPSAKHDPLRGYWCRVCETCFKSREGYNDHRGTEVDVMGDFKRTRRKAVDKAYLEVSRLEKRMTKLTKVLTDPRIEHDQTTVSYFRRVSGQKSQQRLLEESVVDWQDDANVSNCPFCQQEFTSYTFRRHHCRLCGRVVCADLVTTCSTEIELNVDATHVQDSQTEKPQIRENGNTIAVAVRICRDCKGTLFDKTDFARSLATIPPDQRAFRNLKQFENGIRAMLPRFQKLLLVLQDPDSPPTATQLAEATKVRKRLTDAFSQYDTAARRIRDLPSPSPTQQKVQKQIHMQASQFLHLHMLPLKSLPKILKHAQPPSSGTHSRNVSSSSLVTVNGHLSPEPHGRRDRPSVAAIAETHDTSSQPSQSSQLSALEDEEKEAREQLVVLEEQRFMVGEMLADAQRRRKFEEVESLGRNVVDLEGECAKLREKLEGVKKGFEEAYEGYR